MRAESARVVPTTRRHIGAFHSAEITFYPVVVLVGIYDLGICVLVLFFQGT